MLSYYCHEKYEGSLWETILYKLYQFVNLPLHVLDDVLDYIGYFIKCILYWPIINFIYWLIEKK